MDVQTAWVAVRALGLATGLLVHDSAPQPPATGARAIPMSTEIAAEHWRYVPHGMSMDQALAALSR
jgi:hypothetical protein